MAKRAPRSFKPTPGSSTPLYLQLARFLSDEVLSGRYEAHEALPSERMLSESLGLSRVTTRKAIDQLTMQGLIERRPGSGNYIAPRIEQALSRHQGRLQIESEPGRGSRFTARFPAHRVIPAFGARLRAIA